VVRWRGRETATGKKNKVRTSVSIHCQKNSNCHSKIYYTVGLSSCTGPLGIAVLCSYDGFSAAGNFQSPFK
jgi:hypothetical protein